MGPLGDVERGAAVESVVTEIGVRQDQQVQGQQVIARDNAGRLADAESPPESPGAVAVGGVGPGADPSAGGLDNDVALDQVQVQLSLARQRALVAVVSQVGPADANVSDQPDGAFLAETTRDSAGVAPSTTLFLVPGLPVRDVRLALEAEGLAVGWGGAVVVTQELGDGRLVELELVPLFGSDPWREDVLEERNEFLGRRRREGWSMAVRDVSGGVAVLSGPLAELELAGLLDLTLGLR